MTSEGQTRITINKQLEDSNWDLEKLYTFLVNDCSMGEKRVHNTFKKMKQVYK